MNRYQVVAPIMLTFLTPQDSYDASFSDGEIESDGVTIWRIYPGHLTHPRHESITTANAIDLWLETGAIKAI